MSADVAWTRGCGQDEKWREQIDSWSNLLVVQCLLLPWSEN